MNIREAVSADINILCEIEAAIIRMERAFDETLADTDFHYYDFQQLIDSPSSKVLVAEIDGELVGSGFAEIKKAEHYLKHREFAYIGLMYTHPDHRGKGINRSIVHLLKQWCMTKAITELRLVVYHNNTAAIAAYQKMGFGSHVLEMRAKL